MNQTTIPLWNLELLGGLRLTRHDPRSDAEVERFRTNKAASLLAYLAYQRGPHSRDQLCSLFWPENEMESARNNLRVTLSNLRRILEPQGEIAKGTIVVQQLDTVEISPALVTDVERFTAALAAAKYATTSAEQRAALETMLAAYGGPLLSGFYTDWIVPEANRLEDLFISHLRALLQIMVKAGELESALDIARRAVALAPTREELLRESMQLGMKCGQHGAVIAEFAAWEKSAIARDSGVGAASRELLRIARNLAAPAKASPLQPAAPLGEDNSAPPNELGRSLPSQWTTFFGRENELETLRTWLFEPKTRLITITGPGGAGKTRLAQELARQLAKSPSQDTEHWFGLVEWVPLADLPTASLIPGAILDALKAPRGQEQVEDIISALRSGHDDAPGARLLLVLDNFESLIDDGASLVRALLKGIPELVCVVTSRKRLGLAGERPWPLQTLEVPAFDAASVKPWVGFENLAPASVRLFLDRAKLVQPDFTLTASNADAIARLCARLEGLPLTLELAAARIALFSPAQILAGLDQQIERDSLENPIIGEADDDDDASFFAAPKSIDWTNDEVDANDRHRSLRAAIAWSERQLPPHAARFWSMLSVFRGGWTLDAAAFVCDEPDAAPFVLALRDVSLISLDTSDGLPRGRQLEALREYAAEGLQPEVKEAAIERHARYFLNWAETIAPQLTGAKVARFLVRFEAERGNLRSALEWLLRNDVEGALRLACAMWWTWELRGRVPEGRLALARVLKAATDAFPDLESSEPGSEVHTDPDGAGRLLQLVASARTGAGKLATIATDHEDARVQLEAALALCRRLNDDAGVADCLYSLGYMRLRSGDLDGARGLCDESIAIYRALGERSALCDALYNRALVALYEGDFETVRTLTGERLIIHRASGEARGVAISLENLGLAALFSGEIEAARTYLAESLSLFEKAKEWPSIIRVLWAFGHSMRAAGEREAARDLFVRALNFSREHQLPWNWPYLMEAFAALAAEAGDAPRAARLFGGAAQLRETHNEPLPGPMFSAELDRAITNLRSSMGDAYFNSEWQVGLLMSSIALVEFALREDHSDFSPES